MPWSDNLKDPGYFRTPLTEQYSTDPKYKHFNDYVMMRVPAKRWGDPMDLAGAVIFLASSASDYVTGCKYFSIITIPQKSEMPANAS